MMGVNLTSMSFVCADCVLIVPAASWQRLPAFAVCIRKTSPRWPRRGHPLFAGAERCVRSTWDDQTIGFFCALFVKKTKQIQQGVRTHMWFRMLHQSFRWLDSTKGWTAVRGVFIASNFGSGGWDHFLRSLKTRFAETEPLKPHRRVLDAKMYQALAIFAS